ncbi:MAG: hypothetical protein NDI77_16755 [Geobacteraceae bacterium]|nr:hypothetical protein [Geobacteraceae bacterium]
MKPELLVKSGEDEVLGSIISCISSIECSNFFSSHLGKDQTDQKEIVAAFQRLTFSVLRELMPDVEWRVEYCPSQHVRDSIDIFGKGNGFVVVIELDKNRADQVAKKFVSRMAILASSKTYFISLCYPGTEKMNKPECKKYFGYCSTLACRMGNQYAGFFINQKTQLSQ